MIKFHSLYKVEEKVFQKMKMSKQKPNFKYDETDERRLSEDKVDKICRKLRKFILNEWLILNLIIL